MKIFRSRAAGALAAAAALSLTATPAMARGWHRHDDGIDAGDLFAGLLIVGGIAAVASVASKANKDRQARDDDRYRDYPDDQYRHVPPQRYDDRDAPSSGYGDAPPQDQPYDPGNTSRMGLTVDGAVDACVGAVEQGRRSIDNIDSVNREGGGWRVEGRDRDGRDFACSVDRDGRIRGLAGA